MCKCLCGKFGTGNLLDSALVCFRWTLRLVTYWTNCRWNWTVCWMSSAGHLGTGSIIQEPETNMSLHSYINRDFTTYPCVDWPYFFVFFSSVSRSGSMNVCDRCHLSCARSKDRSTLTTKTKWMVILTTCYDHWWISWMESKRICLDLFKHCNVCEEITMISANMTGAIFFLKVQLQPYLFIYFCPIYFTRISPEFYISVLGLILYKLYMLDSHFKAQIIPNRVLVFLQIFAGWRSLPLCVRRLFWSVCWRSCGGLWWPAWRRRLSYHRAVIPL